MTRLVASLCVALALLVSPLATSNAVASAQMTTCASTAAESSRPDMDDGEKLCTQAICVSVCVPMYLLPVASEQQLHSFAVKAIGGPPAKLSSITPEVEIRPPRNISET